MSRPPGWHRQVPADTMEIAELEISPGGGTAKRQMHAMRIPAVKLAMTITHCRLVSSMRFIFDISQCII